MFHKRPSALAHLEPAASLRLSRLSALEAFSRALLVGIVPLIAMDIFGNKERVAQVYLVAAILTTFATLNVATLERLLRRRRVVMLAAVLIILAMLMLASHHETLLPIGIGLRAAAASLFTVCLSLYIMDHIGKPGLIRAESRRLQHMGGVWVIGPVLGSWLFSHSHLSVPFIISGLSALLLLVYFLRLRFGNDEVVVRARSTASHPLKAVIRYWAQARLRVAYGIVISRSCFWVAMYVYGPIYVIEAGLPGWVAGAMLSGVSILLFMSPLIARLSDRVGAREVIVIGLLITGCSTMALGVLGEPQPYGLIFWISGAIGGVLLDVLGNIPFMRMVDPDDRIAMAGVFSTWREGSELVTPLLVTLVLGLALPFVVFYALLGILHFLAAASTLRLPRRL